MDLSSFGGRIRGVDVTGGSSVAPLANDGPAGADYSQFGDVMKSLNQVRSTGAVDWTGIAANPYASFQSMKAYGNQGGNLTSEAGVNAWGAWDKGQKAAAAGTPAAGAKPAGPAGPLTNNSTQAQRDNTQNTQFGQGQMSFADALGGTQLPPSSNVSPVASMTTGATPSAAGAGPRMGAFGTVDGGGDFGSALGDPAQKKKPGGAGEFDPSSAGFAPM